MNTGMVDDAKAARHGKKYTEALFVSSKIGG